MSRDVDWTWIGEREGAGRQKGYIPEKKVCDKVTIPTSSSPITVCRQVVIGKSGVTVGTGFDIGQHSLYDLKQLKLDATLEEKLGAFVGHYESTSKNGKTVKTGMTEAEVRQKGGTTKFVGLTKTRAQDALAATKLELTADEVKQLDAAVKKKKLDELVRKFDAAVKLNGQGQKFDSLPRGIQTMIASFAFQYGVNFGNGKNANARKLWELLTTGEFETAIELLRSFGDSYGPRRRLEADKLEEGVKSLKSAGQPGTVGPSDSYGPPRPSPSPAPSGSPSLAPVQMFG